MCASFFGTVITAAISAMAAAFAWIVTNFFAEPLLSFFKRRRSIRESLLYAANVDASRKEVFDLTYEELRRHAVALDALNETAPKIVKIYLRQRGFDISEATRGLFGFSNSLGTYDGSRGAARDRIRKALRFDGEF